MTATRRHRSGVLLTPQSSRVIIRPFVPASPGSVTTVIGRAMASSDEEVLRELASLRQEFEGRHLDLEAAWLANYERVRPHVFTQRR